MKKITLSFVSILALSGVLCAGGNVLPDIPVEEPVHEVNMSPFYVGLGYSYLTSNRTATLVTNGSVVKDTDSVATNILLQIGYQYNQYLAIEGRYTTSIGNHSLTHKHLGGLKEDKDIDISNLAVYLKPMYPVGDFSVYGLLGYGKIEREFNTIPQHTWDGSGFQWGAGFQYKINDSFLVFADYVRWYDKNNEPHDRLPRLLDTDFSVVSVGLTYRF